MILFSILFMITGLIVLPILVVYIDHKEEQRFEQLYGNLTVEEVIDLFYKSEEGTDNEQNP